MSRYTAFAKVLVFLLALLPAAAWSDEGTSDLNEMAKHLEFLGYQVERSGDVLTATHPKELNLQIKAFQGGFLAAAFFGTTSKVRDERGKFLDVLNSLNARAIAARYYLDRDNDLAIEAYYPGSYEKERFGIFIRAFWKVGDNLARHIGRLEGYIE